MGTKTLSALTSTIGISMLLLALGLTSSDLVHCSRLDPRHPIPLSNYFEARGFPVPWVATDNGTCGDIPGVPGKILWGGLFQSFIFWIILTTFGRFVLGRRARGPKPPSANPDQHRS